MSRFDYFPLVLMNHSRTMNNRINALLHKRTLSLVWNNFSSSFSWRLKYWQKYFPRRKVIIVFEIEQRCRLEALKLFVWHRKYIQFGTKNIPTFYRWDWKKIVSPALFKMKIREWAPENCPCRLCTTCVHNIGFF